MEKRLEKTRSGYTAWIRGKDYFIISTAKKRTAADARKIATAAGLAENAAAIDYIYKVMQAGTVKTYFSEKWKKNAVAIHTENAGSVGYIEDGDAVIIE